MRVINEFQAYTEDSIQRITGAVFGGDADLHGDAITNAMHIVAREARTIEFRLSRLDWIVGETYSACDMVIYPWIAVLRRALARPAATDLARRFLPIEANYPALGRWLARIESQAGFERTYPPHWRDADSPAARSSAAAPTP
jgi:glutathione S-transferase